MTNDQLEDRQHVSRAFGFSAINQIINRIATFGSGIIVMRILSPSDVGTFAAATAFVVVCTAFNDICMGPAIIQWGGQLQQAVKSATSVAIVSSAIIYGIFFALAPLIGDWLGDAQLPSVLRLLMVLVIIDGISTVPLGLLTRNMQQQLILVIETISLSLQIVITIVLAYHGFGPYALVWGMVVSNGLSATLMLIFARESRLPGLHIPTAKKLIKFGSTLALSNVFRVGTQSCDNIIVGSVSGTTQLGYYQLGYNGGNLPENTIGGTIGRVSFAWFSQIRDNHSHSRKAFHDLTLGLVATTLPFVTALSVLAPLIVHVLYGEKWADAAEIVRILAILGGMRVFLNFFADIFSARGKPLIELKMFIIWFIVLIPSLIFGAIVGDIKGVAIAHVIVAFVIIIPYVLIGLGKEDLPLKQLGRDSIIFLIGAIGQGITSYTISHVIDQPFLNLVVSALGGLLVFVTITFRSLKHIQNSFRSPDHGFAAGLEEKIKHV